MAVLTPANNTCYPKGCAATRESASLEAPEQAQNDILPIKINVTSKSPTLIRTDTTLDHSQKAEKVCLWQSGGRTLIMFRQQLVLLVSSVYANVRRCFTH